MSAEDHLVLSEDNMWVRQDLHVIIVNELIHEDTVGGHSGRFQGAVADLFPFVGDESGFIVPSSLGVAHSELYDFWRRKALDVLFARVGLSLNWAVVTCLHCIIPVFYGILSSGI